MTTSDWRHESWTTSSYSQPDSNCVEIARDEGAQLRDTKARERGQLDVAPGAWRSLLRRL